MFGMFGVRVEHVHVRAFAIRQAEKSNGGRDGVGSLFSTYLLARDH